MDAEDKNSTDVKQVDTQDTNENKSETSQNGTQDTGVSVKDNVINELRGEIGNRPESQVVIPQGEYTWTERIKLQNMETRKISEADYIKVVNEIVDISKTNLQIIRKDKKKIRSNLVSFCINILGVQLGVLCVFILLSAVFPRFNISDNVLMTFMTAIFTETLGAIIVMVKFAFKCDEEVEVIKILNAIVGNYQKFKDSDNKDDKDK